MIRYFYCDFESKVDVVYARKVLHEYFDKRSLYYDPARGIAKDSKNPSKREPIKIVAAKRKLTVI